MSTRRRHNRLKWVALRTLRQVPTIVGETKAGDPIVEIRSVRLVLRDDAHHFRRVEACSKCGNEVPGAAVLNQRDLERPPQSLICQDCVRAGTPYSSPARTVPVARGLVPGANADGSPAVGSATGRAAEDSRVDALERRISEFSSTLEAHRSQWEQALDARIREELTRLGGGAEQRARDDAELRDALASMTEQLSADARASTTRLEDLERRLQELRDGFDVNSSQSGGPPTAAALSTDELIRLEEQTNERLDRLAERIRRTVDVEGDRLAAVERHMEDTAAEGRDLTEAWGSGELSEAQADLGARLEGIDERLQQLQDTIDAQAARMQVDSGTLADTNQRLEALDAEVQAAVSRLTQQVESQGRSLQEAVAGALADLQAATAAAPATEASRLQAIEEAVAERDSELEELHDLHAALDAGMGELRSGIAAGRAADSRNADALDEIYRRLEALSTAQVAARADETRSWRSGRKSAESTTDAGAALAATEQLMREQHELREQVMSLQRAADTATTAAARATSQASALGPLRNDVRILHTQLAEQKAAFEALVKTVERLRRKIPGPAPATAKKAPRATKG